MYRYRYVKPLRASTAVHINLLYILNKREQEMKQWSLSFDKSLMGFLLEKDCFSDWDSELLTGVLTDGVCVWACMSERVCCICEVYSFEILWPKSILMTLLKHFKRHILYCFYLHSSDQIFCMEFHELFQQNPSRSTITITSALWTGPTCTSTVHGVFRSRIRNVLLLHYQILNSKDCPWPCCVNLLY